jgi:putative two-component system response regulator
MTPTISSLALERHPDAESHLELSPILIVDDQPENLWFLEDVLNGAGFTNCRTTTNARNVANIWMEFRPDLVLLDLHMPEVDGITVMKAMLKCLAGNEYLAVIILTSDTSKEAKEAAFAAGAADFLTKPFSPADVLLRIRTLLETRALVTRLARETHDLPNHLEEQCRG